MVTGPASGIGPAGFRTLRFVERQTRLFGGRSRAEALDRYERYTEVPLLVLALAILPLFLIPLTVDVSDTVSNAFFALDWIIWAIFAVDLAIRTYIVENRLSYLVSHWFDIVIVVVPFLRPLRVFQSARAVRILRLSRFTAFAVRVLHVSRDLAQRRGVAYVLLLAGVILLASSGVVYAFERDSGGPIDDFGTALWWGVATITTVGYGDSVPVTPEGRAVAVVLMIVGISLFGFLTASIAAFMVEHESEATLDDVMNKLDSLEAQLNELKKNQSE